MTKTTKKNSTPIGVVKEDVVSTKRDRKPSASCGSNLSKEERVKKKPKKKTCPALKKILDHFQKGIDAATELEMFVTERLCELEMFVTERLCDDIIQFATEILFYLVHNQIVEGNIRNIVGCNFFTNDKGITVDIKSVLDPIISNFARRADQLLNSYLFEQPTFMPSIKWLRAKVVRSVIRLDSFSHIPIKITPKLRTAVEILCHFDAFKQFLPEEMNTNHQ